MTKKPTKKSIALAVSAALAASTIAGEGKCGEGKCGDTQDDKGKEGKCGEGKCGDAKDDKGKEGKCPGSAIANCLDLLRHLSKQVVFFSIEVLFATV